jgi:prepilin signal peptidase PulO-like enzyme (type II secretory pathway)
MFPLIGIAFFAIATIPLVVIDFRERRLPNKLTIPGYLLSLIGLLLTFEWQRVLMAVAISALLSGLERLSPCAAGLAWGM